VLKGRVLLLSACSIGRSIQTQLSEVEWFNVDEDEDDDNDDDDDDAADVFDYTVTTTGALPAYLPSLPATGQTVSRPYTHILSKTLCCWHAIAKRRHGD
jgi:hypothetical protein